VCVLCVCCVCFVCVCVWLCVFVIYIYIIYIHTHTHTQTYREQEFLCKDTSQHVHLVIAVNADVSAQLTQRGTIQRLQKRIRKHKYIVVSNGKCSQHQIWWRVVDE
jgi:hypothetical protein